MAFKDLDEELSLLGYGGGWEDQEKALLKRKQYASGVLKQSRKLDGTYQRRRTEYRQKITRMLKASRPVPVVYEPLPAYVRPVPSPLVETVNVAKQEKLKNLRANRTRPMKRHVVSSGNQ